MAEPLDASQLAMVGYIESICRRTEVANLIVHSKLPAVLLKLLASTSVDMRYECPSFKLPLQNLQNWHLNSDLM